MIRWGIFGLCVVLSIASFGFWRSVDAQQAFNERGIELATREANVPTTLPLAGINVDLTQYNDIGAELEQISDLGFVWVRQAFLWSEIEPEQGQYNWESYDRIVESVNNAGTLKLVAVIDGTPAWARHENSPEHPFAPPSSPIQYGEFAQVLAARYGDVIDYYQIWDEPNIETHWGNLNPRVALYITMLQAAYQGIHDVDDNAMVIAAALAPTTETGPDNINDPQYLRDMYALGAGDYFDAVAGKPYGFDLPPTDRTVDINTMNFSRLILLREIMVENGDGNKPLWGSNWGWNSLPEDWAFEPSIWGSVSLDQQIDYTQKAFERANNEWAWIGGLILHEWEPNAPRDNPIWGFAIKPNRDAWQSVIPRESQVMSVGLHAADTPYAIYDGDWEISDVGADAGADAEINTITIDFEGTEFTLLVRRGDYLAYLGVEVNGQPAEALPRRPNGEAFIALTSERRDPSIDLILVANGLSDDQPHQVVISHRPELGDDQFPIVGFAVGNAPPKASLWVTIAPILFGGFSLLSVVLGIRLPWRNLRLPSQATLRNIADLIIGLSFSAIMLLGAALTLQDTISDALRRDVPAIIAMLGTSTVLYFAPSAWIALVGLLLTAWVIFNRPWIGILLVLFWSAFFASNLDPFFRVIVMVEAMLAITVVATVARFIYEQVKTKQPIALALRALDVIMIAFVVLGAISLLWSEYFSEAFREWRIVLLEPAILYGLIRIQRPSRRELAFLVDTFLFIGALISVIGIIQYITDTNVVVAEGGTRRLTSIYGSPNSVGLMLGRAIPFAVAYIVLPLTPWRRWWGATSAGLMLLAVALSQSVGAIILGIPAGIAVVLLAWQGRKIVPVLGGLGILGGLALIPLSRVLPRLRQLTDFSSDTTVVRINLWRSTGQLLEDYPLTGVGLDQFLYAYRSRYILPQAWEDPDLSHPHNVLLDYWVRLGILGLLLGVAMQVFFWAQALSVYRTVRHTDPLKFALLIGTMGAMMNFLAHGIVDMAHFNINLSFVVAMLLALVIQLDVADHAPES